VVGPTGVLIHADISQQRPDHFQRVLGGGKLGEPLSVFIADALLTPAPGKFITTFPEAADAMLTGRT